MKNTKEILGEGNIKRKRQKKRRKREQKENKNRIVNNEENRK